MSDKNAELKSVMKLLYKLKGMTGADGVSIKTTDMVPVGHDEYRYRHEPSIYAPLSGCITVSLFFGDERRETTLTPGTIERAAVELLSALV